MLDGNKRLVESGPWVQVSRLGNPLFNEVIVPLGKKDEWNGENPEGDSEYLPNVQHPELAGLLPVLYPGVFPNLAGLSAARADLAAILLTGIPSGVVPGFQNFTGPTNADMLRLNVAVPPTPTASANPIGLIGRRPRRLPERPPARRRHRRDRATGDRGCDLPARRPDPHVRSRRSGFRADAGDHTCRKSLSEHVPVRRDALRRLRHPVRLR